ncbi:MAG: 50S ribosomal protein L18e [Candidatus Micrarchaeales archaeon]|uniref:50S ribosomal protein L18e n=1 Tax=Candidatus Micrarchaeum acidiphilum ARMAN-2 TaxID=425595 RepID=C7DIN7_MICA2|nr:MAG: 50S ribosomal protein L18e [Candidatus Micrarchaeum acidiphilum ARMAN-2]MCW6161613.1 50S ribosomal protein L18e [Candidatus Micrarchaeales archaeon]
MKTNAENNQIKEWIGLLKSERSKNRDRKLYGKLIKMVDMPKRKRHVVDLYKINENSNDGDVVIVPGKVLSKGSIDHKISLSAIWYSQSAKKTLEKANCSILPFSEALKQKKIKIVI